MNDTKIKIRYKKQHDKFRCAPIALLNAMKWAGAKVSYKDWIDYLCTLCNCSNSRGTAYNDLIKAVRACSKGLFSFKEVESPTLKEIRNHIKKGGAVVLLHQTYIKPRNLHASLLISGNKRNEFASVNGFIVDSFRTVAFCSGKTIQRRVINIQDLYFALFLTRKE